MHESMVAFAPNRRLCPLGSPWLGMPVISASAPINASGVLRPPVIFKAASRILRALSRIVSQWFTIDYRSLDSGFHLRLTDLIPSRSRFIAQSKQVAAPFVGERRIVVDRLGKILRF